MSLFNAVQLYEARALALTILRRRRWAKAAATRGDVEAVRHHTVEVVVLRRRLDRLGRRAA